MNTTKTIYRVESHKDSCTSTDPANCTTRGHWEYPRDADSIDEAMEWAETDDSPAARITEIVTVVRTRVIRKVNSALPVG